MVPRSAAPIPWAGASGYPRKGRGPRGSSATDPRASRRESRRRPTTRTRLTHDLDGEAGMRHLDVEYPAHRDRRALTARCGRSKHPPPGEPRQPATAAHSRPDVRTTDRHPRPGATVPVASVVTLHDRDRRTIFDTNHRTAAPRSHPGRRRDRPTARALHPPPTHRSRPTGGATMQHVELCAGQPRPAHLAYNLCGIAGRHPRFRHAPTAVGRRCAAAPRRFKEAILGPAPLSLAIYPRRSPSKSSPSEADGIPRLCSGR